MIAIISDIHANLEALQAVLEDIEKRNIDKIYCLGDIIGYGPNPNECIELVKNFCEFFLLGEHENITLSHAESSFGVRLQIAIQWTRNQIHDQNFLINLQRRVIKNNRLYVHGLLGLSKYIFPWRNNECEIKSVFTHFDHLCFSGQNHIPGVFTDDNQYHYAGNINNRFLLPSTGQYAIDVGSVGQPRDNDPRASYAILDEQTILWVRVIYDYKTTVNKIKKIKAFPDILGERLCYGR